MTLRIWVRWYSVWYSRSSVPNTRKLFCRSYLVFFDRLSALKSGIPFFPSLHTNELLHFRRKWKLSPLLYFFRRNREKEATRRNVSLQLMNVTGHERARIHKNKWKANKVTCRHESVVGAPKKYIAVTVRICIGRRRRIKTNPETLKASAVQHFYFVKK